MFIRCCYCHKIIGFSKPIITLRVSYGVCKKCYKKQRGEYNGKTIRLGPYHRR